MSNLNSRQLMPLLICLALISLAAQVRAQSVVIKPDRLREGDGKTRNVTLEANVATGAHLSVSVSYSSDPNSGGTGFIPKFSVQDNSGEDRDPQEGKIRLVLPKAFDKTGVYLIEVDEPRSTLRLVHEPNNTSYLRQFVDWLVTAAGGGQRGAGRKSALERIEEITKNQSQDKVAVWTAPLPPVGQEIDPASRSVKITTAVMPSWSRKANQIACSAWRNGKWIITAFAINRTGVATQLWQWNPQVERISDFSPEWSPNGDAIAFVRLTPDRKSDVWIVQLDKNFRPSKEVKFTNIGNVHAVLGWDKDLGLLFETKGEAAGSRQTWATSVGAGAQPTALSDVYNLVRGSARLRRTVIYAHENEGPPLSALFEMDASGKRWPLLIGDYCLYKWPTVSHDEKLLAFDSDCPR